MKNQNNLLQQGLQQLNISLSSDIEKNLISYLSLLEKWNKTYNLTAITNEEEMVTQHLLDSLSIHHYLTGARIIDVGTGAGLPGIPLALANPHREFVLLDSNGKKIRFLQQVCHDLNIANVSAIQDRVDTYKPDICFDNIVTRAFASLADMLRQTQHLCCPGGKFLAMKGKIPQEELEDIGNSYTIVEIRQLKVPGLDAERHLIIIEESHSG